MGHHALARADTAALHHLLGQAYAAAGQPDPALRELRAAAAGDLKVEEFVFDLGQMQLRAGDFTGALATFDQAAAASRPAPSSSSPMAWPCMDGAVSATPSTPSCG